jgi:hypothetical protein
MVPFKLQEERFSYLNISENGWHPFIAKDNFHELLFKIDNYYDTGDEALWIDSNLIDFRRKNDIENDCWLDINNLLRDTFTNLQIDLENKIIISESGPINNLYKINALK